VGFETVGAVEPAPHADPVERPYLKFEDFRPINGPMKISGSTPLLPPAANQARATRRPETDAPAQTPSPTTTLEPSQPEAPAETGKPHGLVRAADHSNRSDVAALRQWINHPDLRISLPDLSTEHKAKGFQKAAAAYEAAAAIDTPQATDSPSASDPAPIVTDPPLVADPAPVTEPDVLDVLLPDSTPGMTVG
jgi:hypothetical protein